MALPKQEGLTWCLKSISCVLGAEKEAVVLKKLFSCLVAPCSDKFWSCVLALHHLPRSETGTFENTNCFLVVWGVYLEERQGLHFWKDVGFFFPSSLPGKSKQGGIYPGKDHLFCFLSYNFQSSCLLHLPKEDLLEPPTSRQLCRQGSTVLC